MPKYQRPTHEDFDEATQAIINHYDKNSSRAMDNTRILTAQILAEILFELSSIRGILAKIADTQPPSSPPPSLQGGAGGRREGQGVGKSTSPKK